MKCTSLLCRISASVALAAALAVAPALHAQQAIQVFLSAVDADGKPVSDLRAEDINIMVDGSACTMTKFDAIDWPVKLTLMVDNGPVHTDALRQLREAVRLFLAELPTDMEVSVISIDPAPRWIYRPGNDRVKMLSSLDLLIPDQGAPKFIDALAEAADRVNKDKTDKNKEKGNYFPVFMMVGSSGIEGS
ncbi:MAG TPA: VWA domain-containing protein, partial [Vicinamibacterales bacterium]|nr:VWA domain-containing protein [Vicinamibacterales bacterium]